MGRYSVDIRDYIDLYEKMNSKEIDAVREAAKLAREVTTTKFEQVNEWRQTYGDIASNGINRIEFDAAMKNQDEKIAAAAKGKVTWATMIVVAFLAVFWWPQL
jgi:hypothetical protein